LQDKYYCVFAVACVGVVIVRVSINVDVVIKTITMANKWIIINNRK